MLFMSQYQDKERRIMGYVVKLDTTRTKRKENGMVVVTGAPGSGKSTYVRDKADSTDMIYDFDEIAKAISNMGNRDERPEWAYAIVHMMRGMIAEYRGPTQLWMVGTMPSAWEKRYYAKRYNAKIYVIDPGIDKVKQQLQADKTRPNKTQWLSLIDKWYDEYEPYCGEFVISV